MFSKKKNKSSDGVIKSIMAAHVILFLHLILFAALGLLVVFLDGLMQYMGWILLGGLGIIGLSAYWFIRRLRREGKSLKETLRSPVFRGRNVEVSLLGGMATLKLDQQGGSPEDAIEAGNLQPPLQLRVSALF